MDNNTTFLLSKSAYMVIPDDENTSKDADKKGVFYYKDNKDNLNITICSNLSTSDGAKVLKSLKNNISTGAKKIIEGNAIIYEKDGIYSIFVKNTQYNDTIILQSADKNLLLACWKTVKYHDPAVEIKVNDTGSSGSSGVVSAVEQTENAVQSNYASSTSSSTSSSSSSSSSDSYYETFGYSTGSSGVEAAAPTVVAEDIIPVSLNFKFAIWDLF